MLERKLKTWRPINKILILSLCLQPISTMADYKIESLFDLSLEELMNISVASLFDESVLEASSSVTVVTEETWQNNGARRANEIMTYQPATMAHPTLGGSDAFAIRGFSNTLSSRGIATLLDGVPLNTYSFGTAQYFLANFDLGALQRAELIRGPGSAIYGSDAFHGVFSLSTFSSAKDTIDTEIGLGSPGYARAHARFSQSVGENQRFSGAVATTQQGDGDIVFNTSTPGVQGVREDAYISKTAFLKSEHVLNEQWQTQWGLYYNNWDSTDFPSFGEVSLGENDISDGKQEFYMLSANASYQWTNTKSLELKSYFWNTDQQFEYEYQLVPLQAQEDQRYGISVIIKDEGESDKIRWLLGAGLDKAEVLSAELVSGQQAFDGLKRSINNIFAELRVPFLEEKLMLDLGARVDDYSDFGSHFTPRLGLVYLLEKNQAVKFQYGNAFRAPVASELTASGTIQGNVNLAPETIDTYELVWMKLEDIYSWSATLYKSDWKDAIIIVTDNNLTAPFTRRYENQGEFSSQGLELESSILLSHWKIDGAYSFIKSEDEIEQTDFIAFPQHIVQFGIGSNTHSNFDFRLYNIAYFDVYASTSQGSNKLDTIWQANLNINYHWSNNLALTLDIRNLLNRKDPVPSLWGNAEGLPVDGIQFSSYLRYTF